METIILNSEEKAEAIIEKIKKWVRNNSAPEAIHWTAERSNGNCSDCFDDGYHSALALASKEIGTILGMNIDRNKPNKNLTKEECKAVSFAMKTLNYHCSKSDECYANCPFYPECQRNVSPDMWVVPEDLESDDDEEINSLEIIDEQLIKILREVLNL